MAIGVDIELDVDEVISELTRGLSRSSKAVDRAITRTIRKTMRWLASQTLRLLSAETGVDRKALKARVRQRVRPGERFGQVWIGLLPIDAHKAGRARQNAAGVRVKSAQFESAFLMQVGGSEKVMRRVHRGPGSAALGRQGGRLPVEKVTIDISQAGQRAAAAMRKQGAERFRTLLEQELNYAVMHER